MTTIGDSPGARTPDEMNTVLRTTDLNTAPLETSAKLGMSERRTEISRRLLTLTLGSTESPSAGVGVLRIPWKQVVPPTMLKEIPRTPREARNP